MPTTHKDYKPSKSRLLQIANKLGDSGPALWVLSRVLSNAAPYFSTISPTLTHFSPGHVEATMPKRRSVQNHLGSVHAIAMCNLAEYVGGGCIEISLDQRMRWIPVGMQVQYLKIARTKLRAVCKLDRYDWLESQDVTMPVDVFDTNHQLVFHADIDMRISPRKHKT